MIYHYVVLAMKTNNDVSLFCVPVMKTIFYIGYVIECEKTLNHNQITIKLIGVYVVILKICIYQPSILLDKTLKYEGVCQ